MTVIIKGAGDLATGVAYKLKRCGLSVVMTETKIPTTVRRTVAFSKAVYEGKAEVQGVKAILAHNVDEIKCILDLDHVAVIVDENCEILNPLKPDVLIDATIAKKNISTKINDAPLVIGLGPGFTAKLDCDCVIETKRGHYLGDIIYSGCAIPNTGIPGEIGGYKQERIIRAVKNGIFAPNVQIGDNVSAGDIVAFVDDEPIYANIDGVVRGLLQENVPVTEGMKSGDIDPRNIKEYCFSISDKARCIAGGVAEAIFNKKSYPTV